MNSIETLLLAAILAGPPCLNAQFSIPWSIIEGGGGPSAGGGFSLHGTVGQSSAGAMIGGGFTLVAGYEAGLGSKVSCASDVPPGLFVIDRTRSLVTASGHLAGYPLQPQGASSLAAAYRGVIQAVVSSSAIGFPGGSVVDAETTGSWRPRAGGDDGAAPADYGGIAIGPAGLVTVYAALRNLVLDVTSGCVPLANGHFSAAALTFLPASASPATLDILALTPFPVSFSGPFASPMPNQSVTDATAELTGDVETLTLPILANMPLTVFNPGDSLLSFQGTLVARRTNAPPVLAIRHGATGNLILTWPNPSSGYALQQTASMSAPGGGWVDVTQPPVLVGPNHEVTLPATGRFCVFRLRRL